VKGVSEGLGGACKTSQRIDVLIHEAQRQLEAAGVWAPRDDAIHLLAHVHGGSNPVDPSKMVPKDVVARFWSLVRQRASRVPLAHITGVARLGDIQVEVGPGVFVPRRQSEPFLTWALSALQDKVAPTVVDLCTGSGAIALAVAHARPDALVLAVDIDPVSLDCARRNARAQAEAGDTPITVLAGDVTNPALLHSSAGSVDLVLANPPYVPLGVPLLTEWGVHHTTRAIYSGEDGLDTIRAVIARAGQLLKPQGQLAVEHDDNHPEPVSVLLAESGAFTEIKAHRDQDGRPRWSTARRTEKVEDNLS
jgi:release factor glutamine methyltransferase